MLIKLKPTFSGQQDQSQEPPFYLPGQMQNGIGVVAGAASVPTGSSNTGNDTSASNPAGILGSGARTADN